VHGVTKAGRLIVGPSTSIFSLLSLVDGLQLLPRFEAYGLSRRDADFGPGTRIAPNAGFARTHIKNAESAQLNALTVGQGFLHALKDRFYRQLRLGLGDAGFVDHFVDDIELNHGSALLNCQKGRNLQMLWDFYAGCQWTKRDIAKIPPRQANTALAGDPVLPKIAEIEKKTN